jgi:hypothetical protein
LSQYAYTSAQEESYTGKTLDEIYKTTQRKYEKTGETSTEHQFLDSYLKEYPELKNMKLVAQSNVDAGIDKKLLYAYAFEDPNGTVYIVYRGTGDGKWVDSAEGLIFRRGNDSKV